MGKVQSKLIKEKFHIKDPRIIPRKSVNESMETELKIVDELVPIGRRQR
jgi:F0F1-type ATP synthase alpha subunit